MILNPGVLPPDVGVFYCSEAGDVDCGASLFRFLCYILLPFPIISFVSLLPTAFKYHYLQIYYAAACIRQHYLAVRGCLLLNFK